MPVKKLFATLPFAIVFLATVSACPAGSVSLLRQVADVPLPGGTTRFDYQSLDPITGHLFLSHMGDGTLVVFDTSSSRVLANVPGFPTVTGVLAVPKLKRLYASAAGSHEVVVMDTDTLAVIKRVPGGKFPDGLAYSPETQKVFVSDEAGEAETVIDAKTNERVATIPMGGEVGNTQYDPVSHLIFACVQTRNEIVAIDPNSNQVNARYPLPGGEHPHGFYIDDQHGKAYIACQGDNKLLVFNMRSHTVESTFPVGGDPDVLAYDRGLNRLYVACEAGVVSVFDATAAGLQKLDDVEVGPNCHSVSVDSRTHRVYFPLKNLNGAPVLRIMEPTRM
jgi:YVTN family beta-propeller protein